MSGSCGGLVDSDGSAVFSDAPLAARSASRGDGVGGERTSRRLNCETCGAPARVVVLERYAAGKPVRRSFCLHCVDSARLRVAAPRIRRARLRLDTLAILVGCVLLFVGFLADFILPARQSGFGWYQCTGVIAGLLLAAVGVLGRVDLLALGGLFMAGASLGADWIGLQQGAGIGSKQLACAGAGAVLVALGLLFRSIRTGRGRSRTSERLRRPAAQDAQATLRPT